MGGGERAITTNTPDPSHPGTLEDICTSLYLLLSPTDSRMTNKLGVLSANITMLSMNLMELKIELENSEEAELKGVGVWGGVHGRESPVTPAIFPTHLP